MVVLLLRLLRLPLLLRLYFCAAEEAASNKRWWSVKRWRIHAHAPDSHRVVTLSHSNTQPSDLTFSDRTAGRCGRRGNYFLHHNFSLSLSLSRSLVAQTRRPRAQPTRADHARVGTEAQAGGRLSAVNGCDAIRVERKGTELLSGEAYTVCQVFSSLSLSLCPFSLSLSVSLSLSPAGRRLVLRARRAPRVVVLACRWSSPRTAVRRAARPCAASGQGVVSPTPSVVTPC